MGHMAGEDIQASTHTRFVFPSWSGTLEISNWVLCVARKGGRGVTFPPSWFGLHSSCLMGRYLTPPLTTCLCKQLQNMNTHMPILSLSCVHVCMCVCLHACVCAHNSLQSRRSDERNHDG